MIDVGGLIVEHICRSGGCLAVVTWDIRFFDRLDFEVIENEPLATRFNDGDVVSLVRTSAWVNQI
jgi:hypothetical protein